MGGQDLGLWDSHWIIQTSEFILMTSLKHRTFLKYCNLCNYLNCKGISGILLKLFFYFSGLISDKKLKQKKKKSQAGQLNMKKDLCVLWGKNYKPPLIWAIWACMKTPSTVYYDLVCNRSQNLTSVIQMSLQSQGYWFTVLESETLSEWYIK